MLIDADLQIMLTPHLLSLANGFERVDKELHRLANVGYIGLVGQNAGHAVNKQRMSLFNT